MATGRFQVDVVDSVSAIDAADWATLAREDGDDPMGAYELFGSMEGGRVGAGGFAYVVVHQPSRLAAVVPLFWFPQFGVDTTLPEPWASAAAAVRRALPGALKVPALFCGHPLGQGQILTNGASFPEDAAMAAIWDVADRQDLSWIIFKDFSAADLKVSLPAASTAPFFTVPSFPYATLDLSDLGSFDDYLAQLKGKARRNARRKMRKFAAHPDLKLETKRDWADVVPEMVDLYEQVLEQADMRLDHIDASFFSAVADSSLDAPVILARRDDRLVGFLLCLLSSSHCIDLRAGLDYDVAREHSLWFVLHYESIRLAADKGCRQVEFLQSTYHAKQEVGCCLRPLVHQVTHRRPRARALLKHALPPAAAKTVRDTVATT